MASYFLDTSAFVKRYHPEAGASQVLALFNQPQSDIQISRLTLVETRSAFAVKVRMGHISETTASLLWIQLISDLAAGVFEVLPISDTHYQRAEELIGRHSFRCRLRTLDAVQLAVAIEQHEHATLKGFVLADQALCEAASAEKIPTVLLL